MSELSRRMTLAWIAAAGAFAANAAQAAEGGPAAWDAIVPAPATAPGYGHDPDLKTGAVPWPLTLSPHQRETVRVAADLMLPADSRSPSGGALPLAAFIDEWISAPYPVQQLDRAVILPGLVWLDAETGRRFGANFAAATDPQRRAVFDAIAFRATVQPGYEEPARFFARLRSLLLAGFYSLPEGIADIGYLGNTPQLGAYPGPSEEAMANLNASLVKLGLKPVTPG